MSYYSKRHFTPASPQDNDDESVEKLIDKLKKNIDAEKLKDMKSALSKLKLSINNKYPLFTKDTATFGAYIYAINNKKKKSAKSILNAALKKNYTFIRFPLKTLLSNLSKSDMKIIIDDILSVSTKWHLEGIGTIKAMLDAFPNETAQLIEDGHLNIYEKGEERIATTIAIIKNGNEKAALGALNTFFGKDYIKQYGIHPIKLQQLIDVINEKPKSFGLELRKKFFYDVAAKTVFSSMLADDYKNNIFDSSLAKIYVSSMIEKGLKNLLIQTIQQVQDEHLRMLIIGADESILQLVIHNHPSLVPQYVQDIFLF